MNDTQHFFKIKEFGQLHFIHEGVTLTSTHFSNPTPHLGCDYSEYKLEAGDKVILLFRNESFDCLALFALWEIGCCVIPIAADIAPEEMEYLKDLLKPKIIVSSKHKIESFSNSTKTDQENCLILFTSGSSGKPKGVVFTKDTLLKKMDNHRKILPVHDFSRTLCCLPLHFGHGLFSLFLFPLSSGCDVYLAPSANLEIVSRLGEIIDQYKITCFSSVPSLLKVATHFSASPQNKSLKKCFCASAPLSKELWDKALQWTHGVPICNMLGSTEFLSWFAGNLNQSLDSFEENSFEFPWEAQYKILEDGQLALKSSLQMKKYFEDTSKTEQSFEDGWFKTGDLVEFRNGKLYLKGRIDDLINLSGTKVDPLEIMSVINTHPDSLESFCFGIKKNPHEPDHAIGCVIATSNTKLSPKDIQEFCKGKLSPHKIPSRLKFISKMPLNSRGKLDRNVLKQMLINGD